MQSLKSLAVLAGNRQQTQAIRRAAALALENGAKLTLIDVVTPIPRFRFLLSPHADVADIERSIAEERRMELRELAEKYVDPSVCVDIVVSIGETVREVVLEVLRNKHDLVIKTAASLPYEGSVFGSVARSLLRICPCPVLILKPAIHGAFDQVLAAIDVETKDDAHRSLNQTILESSIAIARSDDATLHVVSTWDDPMEGPLRRRAGDVEVDAAHSQYEAKIQRSVQKPSRSTAN